MSALKSFCVPFQEKTLEEVNTSSAAEVPQFKEAKSKLWKNSWTQGENLIYAIFLCENGGLFANEESRRQHKVFRLLSQNIKSRTINQVKSHHQKMLLKHRSIPAIIEWLLSRGKPSGAKGKRGARKTNTFENSIMKLEEDTEFWGEEDQLERGIELGVATPAFPSEAAWFSDI